MLFAEIRLLLENYNINVARHLVSGVDVWLNNPRRPMEASGTSGEKASVNGVVNFSILDGWWAEGYNTKNGWAIGTNAEYYSYEEQDLADSESIYRILEDKIIPTYYNKDENGKDVIVFETEIMDQFSVSAAKILHFNEEIALVPENTVVFSGTSLCCLTLYSLNASLIISTESRSSQPKNWTYS